MTPLAQKIAARLTPAQAAAWRAAGHALAGEMDWTDATERWAETLTRAEISEIGMAAILALSLRSPEAAIDFASRAAELLGEMHEGVADPPWFPDRLEDEATFWAEGLTPRAREAYLVALWLLMTREQRSAFLAVATRA